MGDRDGRFGDGGRLAGLRLSVGVGGDGAIADSRIGSAGRDVASIRVAIHDDSAAGFVVSCGAGQTLRDIRRDPPGLHADDAVRRPCLVDVVGDMHDGGAARLQLIENRHDLAARDRIEHGRRLVEHDHRRQHGQRAGDGDALLLAAAHQGRIRGAETGHIDRVQRIGDATSDIRARHAEILRAERHIVLDHRRDDLILRILEHRADTAARATVRIRVRPGPIREHPFAEQCDGAAIRCGQSRDDPRQRGLARAVRADDAQALAGPNRQIHIIQRPGRPAVVAETDVAQFRGDGGAGTTGDAVAAIGEGCAGVGVVAGGRREGTVGVHR